MAHKSFSRPSSCDFGLSKRSMLPASRISLKPAHAPTAESASSLLQSQLRLKHVARVLSVDAPHSPSSPKSGTEPSASKCPFHQVTAAISNVKEAVVAATAPAMPTSPETQGTIPIPGPDPIGLPVLLDANYMLTEGIHQAMVHFHEKYGAISRFPNPGLIIAISGITGWVFLNDPAGIQHVCVTKASQYTSRYLPDTFYHITAGKGIWGTQGAENALHKRICAAPFRNPELLQRHSGLVADRSQQLINIWRQAAASGSFETDLSVQTQRLVTDMIGRIACSRDFGQMERIREDLAGTASEADGDHDTVLSSLGPLRSHFVKLFVRPIWFLRFLDRLGLPYLRDLDNSVAMTREAMMDMVRTRRAALEAGGGEDFDDLLHSLLTATDKDGQPLSDDAVMWDIYDVLGGIYSTARTIAALLHCVSTVPEVQQRLQQEIDTVLGGAAPTIQSVAQMPYLQSCMKEVMRLYPAVQVHSRRVLQDDVLPSGQAIAKGDVVLMSAYALGRSPDIWEQPLEFNPDRFAADAKMTQQHRFAYLPFGTGPRVCPGQSFAQISVSMMAAALLQAFHFTPVNPTSPIFPVGYDDLGMSFTPTGGLRVRVTPRGVSHSESQRRQ